MSLPVNDPKCNLPAPLVKRLESDVAQAIADLRAEGGPEKISITFSLDLTRKADQVSAAVKLKDTRIASGEWLIPDQPALPFEADYAPHRPYKPDGPLFAEPDPGTEPDGDGADAGDEEE